MRRLEQYLIYAAFFIIFCTGCSKQSITLSLPDIKEYYPVQPGKVFIYRLDSTVIPPFGTALITRSYMAKDSIESEFLDNTDRTSYRVYRYTTDTLFQQGWQYVSTYFITMAENAIEVSEDNLRFIKLKAPVNAESTWKGNTYIETASANSPVRYLHNWDYAYQNINEPYTVLNGTLNNTLTILQQDENSPDTEFDPSELFHERNYSVEVYAKGIGLVYKDFLHWTWQLNPTPAFSDNSYGIRLNLVEYR
ncbi:hypothetical protein [Foetidibacter luteolus]|uniref:hypothetical protein n=1 Tax=Foetidibacter luteolus TaxID=2608880 RepID=UPI00129A2C84|nr:hypothetical protein [Foetidibacter luteolus]